MTTTPPPKDYNRQLFGEIEKFITIKILDREYEVPVKLELLRVFQFLDFKIDYARLCWNGSCQRCVVHYEIKTKGMTKKLDALACRLKSTEGMSIDKMPATIKLK